MCADHCLKNYIRKNNLSYMRSSSAGTSVIKQPIGFNVKKTLSELGIDVSSHKQTKLNSDLIKENDLIVAMGENHKYFVENHFKVKSTLFLDICYNIKSGLKDNNEAIPNW